MHLKFYEIPEKKKYFTILSRELSEDGKLFYLEIRAKSLLCRKNSIRFCEVYALHSFFFPSVEVLLIFCRENCWKMCILGRIFSH